MGIGQNAIEIHRGVRGNSDSDRIRANKYINSFGHVRRILCSCLVQF